uniref:Uncharacterized protein n=1 Tax=Rheinheimera sp. BAL341 TaxID=1708203 RepID=A0A486XPL5_9GAMM
MAEKTVCRSYKHHLYRRLVEKSMHTMGLQRLFADVSTCPLFPVRYNCTGSINTKQLQLRFSSKQQGLIMKHRTEHDSMGPLQVPASALYQAQTQ